MKISTHTLTTNVCQIFIFLADETSKSLTRIKNIPISCNLRFLKTSIYLECGKHYTSESSLYHYRPKEQSGTNTARKLTLSINTAIKHIIQGGIMLQFKERLCMIVNNLCKF